jgi:transposase
MKTQTTASGGVGLGRSGRMSRQRKRDAVLRLLRREDLSSQPAPMARHYG